MTALGLLARWCMDSITSPPLPDELGAVALLRLHQALRLPPGELTALQAILARRPHERRQETPTWSH